jgi:serine protease inhibitor
VDEEGTEAAAATAVTVSRGKPAEQATLLRFDRPSAFALRHASSGAILMMGRVELPEASGSESTS